LRRLGNVTPLISVEGTEIVSDERRGVQRFCQDNGRPAELPEQKVITGVCTSVCQTNIDDLVNEEWLDRLIEMGVMYSWFHVYRPMGESSTELSLTREQQLESAGSSSTCASQNDRNH